MNKMERKSISPSNKKFSIHFSSMVSHVHAYEQVCETGFYVTSILKFEFRSTLTNTQKGIFHSIFR